MIKIVTDGPSATKYDTYEGLFTVAINFAYRKVQHFDAVAFRDQCMFDALMEDYSNKEILVITTEKFKKIAPKNWYVKLMPPMELTITPENIPPFCNYTFPNALRMFLGHDVKIVGADFSYDDQTRKDIELWFVRRYLKKLASWSIVSDVSPDILTYLQDATLDPMQKLSGYLAQRSQHLQGCVR